MRLALVNTVGDQQAAQQPEVPVAARAFFGNCTKWGPQALGFIAQLEEHSYGVGILAETHVGEAESLKLYRDLERLGWAARASHARQKHNGTSGGVVIFGRSICKRGLVSNVSGKPPMIRIVWTRVWTGSSGDGI